MAESDAIFGCGEPGAVRSPALRPAGHQASPVTEAPVWLLLAYLLGRNKQLKPFVVVVFKIKNRVMCIRKDSREKLWLQLSPTRSEPWVQLRIHLAGRLTARTGFPPYIPHSRSGLEGGGQSPGSILSVERIQQQQDGTDANDTSKDERVSSFPKVDPLYQAVHSRKAVGQSVHFAVN